MPPVSAKRDMQHLSKRMQCNLKEPAARANKTNKLELGQALPAHARPHVMHQVMTNVA